eukprot:7139614-Pyramimonas_sp.AAC.1
MLSSVWGGPTGCGFMAPYSRPSPSLLAWVSSVWECTVLAIAEETYGHSCTAPAFQLTGRGGPCTRPRLLWFECGLREE